MNLLKSFILVTFIFVVSSCSKTYFGKTSLHLTFYNKESNTYPTGVLVTVFKSEAKYKTVVWSGKTDSNGSVRCTLKTDNRDRIDYSYSINDPNFFYTVFPAYGPPSYHYVVTTNNKTGLLKKNKDNNVIVAYKKVYD